MSGGWLRIRRWPSRTTVSFSRAWWLSRVWALAAAVVARDASALSRLDPVRSACAWRSARSRWTSVEEYQTSRLPSPASRRISWRYTLATRRAAFRAFFGLNPRSRAATTTLAARRFTSHSHGPGRVSSKSFTSNTSSRSGEPNAPKLHRWASPQSCTVRPERAVVARSDAMISAAPRKNANGETSIRP